MPEAGRHGQPRTVDRGTPREGGTFKQSLDVDRSEETRLLQGEPDADAHIHGSLARFSVRSCLNRGMNRL